MPVDDLEQSTQRSGERAATRPSALNTAMFEREVTELPGTVDVMSTRELLRYAVRKARIYSGDSLIAAEAVAQELEIAERVLDKLRRINPKLVAAAEDEVWAEREAEELRS